MVGTSVSGPGGRTGGAGCSTASACCSIYARVRKAVAVAARREGDATSGGFAGTSARRGSNPASYRDARLGIASTTSAASAFTSSANNIAA